MKLLAVVFFVLLVPIVPSHHWWGSVPFWDRNDPNKHFQIYSDSIGHFGAPEERGAEGVACNCNGICYYGRGSEEFAIWSVSTSDNLHAQHWGSDGMFDDPSKGNGDKIGGCIPHRCPKNYKSHCQKKNLGRCCPLRHGADVLCRCTAMECRDYGKQTCFDTPSCDWINNRCAPAILCPSGHIYVEGASNPTSANSCQLCDAGKFSGGGKAPLCNNCERGKYSHQGASKCESCGPGTFSATDGRNSCTSCPAGKYNSKSSSSECITCPLGKTSARGATFCYFPCQENMPANGGCATCKPAAQRRMVNHCSKCMAGFFEDDGQCNQPLFNVYQPTVQWKMVQQCSTDLVLTWKYELKVDKTYGGESVRSDNVETKLEAATKEYWDTESSSSTQDIKEKCKGWNVGGSWTGPSVSDIAAVAGLGRRNLQLSINGGYEEKTCRTTSQLWTNTKGHGTELASNREYAKGFEKTLSSNVQHTLSKGKSIEYSHTFACGDAGEGVIWQWSVFNPFDPNHPEFGAEFMSTDYKLKTGTHKAEPPNCFPGYCADKDADCIECTQGAVPFKQELERSVIAGSHYFMPLVDCPVCTHVGSRFKCEIGRGKDIDFAGCLGPAKKKKIQPGETCESHTESLDWDTCGSHDIFIYYGNTFKGTTAEYREEFIPPKHSENFVATGHTSLLKDTAKIKRIVILKPGAKLASSSEFQLPFALSAWIAADCAGTPRMVIAFGDPDGEDDAVKIQLGTEDNSNTVQNISAYSTSSFGEPLNSGQMWDPRNWTKVRIVINELGEGKIYIRGMFASQFFLDDDVLTGYIIFQSNSKDDGCGMYVGEIVIGSTKASVSGMKRVVLARSKPKKVLVGVESLDAVSKNGTSTVTINLASVQLDSITSLSNPNTDFISALNTALGGSSGDQIYGVTLTENSSGNGADVIYTVHPDLPEQITTSSTFRGDYTDAVREESGLQPIWREILTHKDVPIYKNKFFWSIVFIVVLVSSSMIYCILTYCKENEIIDGNDKILLDVCEDQNIQ